MSAFLSPLHVNILPPNETGRRQRYVLIAPFVYQSDSVGQVSVPEGFQTDFASIPRLAWRYIDPEDPVILFASVVHDYLYSVQSTSREVADRVLVEAMGISGARWDQRKAVHAAVRMFGGSHWEDL